MNSRRRQEKAFLGTNGYFTIPPRETIRQMIDRLDEGRALGWPGSISIHGNMQRQPGNKRRHEREDSARRPRQKANENRPRGREVLITDRLLSAALRYAAADRTDPFSYNRALSHTKAGLCRTVSQEGESKDCIYDAEEVRDGDGILSYRNITRP